MKKTLPMRLALAIDRLQGEDRKNEAKVSAIMTAEIEKFFDEFESGKFHS